MSAYLIGTATIINHESWDIYVKGVAKTFEQYHGKILFRGKKEKNLAGENNTNISVVIEFKTMQELNIWFHSKEYQALIPTRIKGAKLNLTAYEGV